MKGVEMKRVGSSLILVALAVGCGDDGAPVVDTCPVPGEEQVELKAGSCLTYSDCDAGESCKPSKFIGLACQGAYAPGECMTAPSEQILEIFSVSPIRFTEADGSPNPETDDFTIESGVFRFGALIESDNSSLPGTGTDLSPNVDLPWEIKLGLGFVWQLEIFLRFIDSSDPNFDVECNLAFLSSGEIVGGLVREPGKLLCLPNNSETSDEPSSRAILIEYERCAPEEPPFTCAR
jgi:hypothetical protein